MWQNTIRICRIQEVCPSPELWLGLGLWFPSWPSWFHYRSMAPVLTTLTYEAGRALDLPTHRAAKTFCPHTQSRQSSRGWRRKQRSNIKTRRMNRLATHCNTLQHTATHCNAHTHKLVWFQCGCVCRRQLQYTAAYCKILQPVATYCDTHQRTNPKCWRVGCGCDRHRYP